MAPEAHIPRTDSLRLHTVIIPIERARSNRAGTPLRFIELNAWVSHFRSQGKTMDSTRIAVMEGDQTGQELLIESLRVLSPSVTGVGIEMLHFDLSLENRRHTNNQVVHRAARTLK